MTIRRRFLYSILVITIIPMMIAPIIGIFYMYRVNLNQTSVLINQNMQQIASGINHIVDDIISASNMVVLDEEILDLLQDKKEYEYSFMKEQVIKQKLNNIIAGKLYPYNTEIKLFDFSENIYTTGDKNYLEYKQVIKEDWYIDTIKRNGYFLWYAPAKNYLDNQKDSIMMTRLVKRDYVDACGVLLIQVYPERKVKNILYVDEQFDGTMQYLVNGDGDIILQTGNTNKKYYSKNLFHDIKKNESSDTKELVGEKVLITSKTVEKTDWTIIQITPYNSIVKAPQEYLRFTIILNIIFIIIIIIISYIISDHITISIRELCKQMKKVMKGDFHVKSNISGSKEIDLLSSTFNLMIEKIHQLIHQVKQATKERQHMKFEALQAQINPHFLLNTLNGIKWLCVIEEAKNAEKMLLNLGFLLENTLGKYDDVVTLKDEIELLKKYAEIQKMRYGKLFTIHYTIPEELEDVQVPVLLIQPIVENSILYAFEHMDEIGIIHVTAKEEGQHISIIVSDNGIGITKEKIEHALSDNHKKGKYSSIGLKNVRERIKLYYGKDCDMIINSNEATGTEVVMKVLRKIKGVGE